MGAGRVWWRQDRRWAPPAAVAGFGAAAGGLVLWLGSGLGATLGAEAGFGLAAGFTVAAGSGLRQVWRGRADHDPGVYTDGVQVDLVATGAIGEAAIAKLTAADGTTLAELHLETLHPAGGPVDGLDTVTARVAGRVLRLQHRRPTAPPDDDHRARAASDAADLEVRWVDAHDRAMAVAARTPAPGGDRWGVAGRRAAIAWTVPAVPGRRPARRVLVDEEQPGRVFQLVHPHRRRGPRVRFGAPPELDTAEVLLCVWLCHLLDAHAAAREPWPPAGPDWALVPDDFPSYRVGPAGLGRVGGALPTGSVNVAPGGW